MLDNNITNDSLTNISLAKIVREIRKSVLPNHHKIFNAGSFFKNPIIDNAKIAHFEGLDLSVFRTRVGAKLSAAQLIDRCGWKEKQTGQVRCWVKQPLVLVNYGATQAAHILEFASDVRASVADAFAIELEIEPSVLA